MKIMTRAEAIDRGLPRYFTGKPCIHGHVADRGTLNSACVVCAKEARVAATLRYRKNRDATKNRAR